MHFATDGTVEIEPVRARPEVLDELEQNLVVVYSGIERHARVVLAEQGTKLDELDADATERMHRIKALGYEVLRLLEAGTIDLYGELLHEHWTAKRRVTSSMSDGPLDEHYEAARRAGAIGGKLMGAGGGGFFMFYVRPRERRSFVEAMEQRGLRILRFRFDEGGARIVANVHAS
jgi:D-glycero-alpha-D-manno-heptose-7-phosphate kinase